MFRKLVEFVLSHKVASLVFLLPFVGVVAASAVLAYQERRRPGLRLVRGAADEPRALPSDEEQQAHCLETAWRR